MAAPHDQRDWDVRFDWASTGADAIGADASFAVIVDVLSFTTALSVAIDAGTDVFPYQWNDDTAAAFARAHDATLAVGRSQAARPEGAGLVSLSPVSIRSAPGLKRIVLPSPNGSALASHLAGRAMAVTAACLRNRRAVARWLVSQRDGDPAAGSIAVIAAGERWPDGSLRAAAEDMWGAGAVIAALAELGVAGLSPEAGTAAAAFRAAESDLGAQLLACGSGVELAGHGYRGDVTIAAELDASDGVPVLAGLRFTRFASGNAGQCSHDEP
jgi:2-phosphosulfolactate phosphatase